MLDCQAFNQQLTAEAFDFDKTYVFYGQTPFLSEESAQLLIQQAKNNGYPQRDIYYIDNKAKFQGIINSLQSPGLFDPNKIIELRFDTDKPTKKIGEQVAKIAQHRSNNLVIIQASGLTYKAQKEKWFADIQKAATVVISKPIYANQLPNWIHQRATQLQLQLESKALQKIHAYSEGNLLWTNQILMQLAHSDYPQPIQEAVIEQMLADLSVFHIEDLVQAIVNKSAQALKIVKKLEQENESLVFITTVLHRDFETTLKIRQSGLPFQQACHALRIWKNKQRLYQTAISHFQPEQLAALLRQLASIDKINKGQGQGDAWLLLNQLVANAVISKANPR